MGRKFFGTDGIRGTANKMPMTAEVALRVGMAAGACLRKGDHRHRVVIGKDTRLSGYMLEPALTSGFVSVGMDVILVGPMPTPAVAMLNRSLRADLGVMISASHNLFQDNGIKLFNQEGLKLSDEKELEIESLMQKDMTKYLVSAEKLGRAKRLDDAPGRYIEFVKHTFPKRLKLNGIKIVLDCANGAAYHLGPTIFWELGAEVFPLGVQPNGFNINDQCGSTFPSHMCEEVIKRKADIGIALDGDADRLVVCDERGKIIDGDQIIALIATAQKEKGKLHGGGIVGTTMSNMGLEKYLHSIELELKRTQVGDRYVASYMRAHGYNVGGEQSGHVILSDYTTTGDGIIAALQLLAVLAMEKRPASEVCKMFTPTPQLLKNVKISKKNPLDDPRVQQHITKFEKKLGNKGRIVVRKSGTEPLIRIMVEGESFKTIREIADKIADVIQ